MTLFVVFLFVTFPIISNGLQLSKSQKTIYCGVRAYDNELIGRVVGPRDAYPGEVPFYALLQDKVLSRKYRTCGGVIISNRWVLTAAHCTLYRFGTWQVVLGDKWNNKTIKVEKIYVHLDFKRVTFENNIALLLLKEPVEFSRNIQPICLPEPGEDETFNGRHGTVAGWGLVDPKEKKLPCNMQITTLPIIRYNDCWESYTKAGQNETIISESMLCAGFSEDGSACFSDPLMVKNKKNWVIAGIVSNEKPDLPGIYTRVGFFVKWIKTTINNHILM